MNDDIEDRELRRILNRQRAGVSTWADDARAMELRRRAVDREFDRREAEMEPVRQLRRMQERAANARGAKP